eukprot:5589396-Karenia_brevis.AAC.1
MAAEDAVTHADQRSTDQCDMLQRRHLSIEEEPVMAANMEATNEDHRDRQLPGLNEANASSATFDATDLGHASPDVKDAIAKLLLEATAMGHPSLGHPSLREEQAMSSA